MSHHPSPSRPHTSASRPVLGVMSVGPLLCSLALGISAPVPVLAQPAVSVGSPFTVNEYTTDNQSTPSVAADPAGGFVVVWIGPTEAPYRGPHSRRFDPSGAPSGGQFRVDTYTTINQASPVVRRAPDGHHIVVWDAFGSPEDDTASTSIQMRQLDAWGVPVGNQLQVNTFTPSNQTRAQADFAEAGELVVAWNHSTGYMAYDVRARVFDSAGDAVGDDFVATTTTTGLQASPRVATGTNGGFRVVWLGDGGGGSGAVGRRFDSAGQPTEDEVLLQETAFPTALGASPDGAFVLGWSESDGSDRGIRARRFASGGEPLGDILEVNTYTTGDQVSARLAVGSLGDFVVVWDNGLDVGGDVYGRRFDPDGTPVGDQFVINSWTTGRQRNAEVAADPSGDFVVVWESNGGEPGTSGGSIQGQRFRVTGDVGGRVFVDSDSDGIGLGEDGLPGVRVDLLSELGEILATTTTDVDGLYAFPKQRGGRVAVEFPAFGDFSPQDQGGDDSIDSDVDPLTGETAYIALPPGVAELDQDAGVDPFEVGDRVWIDLDGDGTQDGGEPGAEGIEVYLTTPGRGTVAQTTTDANGFWAFQVTTGSYAVELGCDPGTLGPADQGGDDSADSDFDPTTVATPVFSVVAGVADPTIDAGLLEADGDAIVCNDNCPAVSNPGQEDSDGDGSGDACDQCLGNDTTGDGDGDGVCADRDCDDGDSTNACAVFADGFESGDACSWSAGC